MKKYFKNLIWKPIAAAFFLLSAIIFIIFPVRFACVSCVVLALICFAYFGLNRLVLYLFKASGPSSYFQDLGFRNVDAIVVGSTIAWKYINYNGLYFYNATGYKRSNLMNFSMLKTYFSHVKENGTVFYIIDLLEIQRLGNYISPCDYQQIHPHIFLKMGISFPAKKQYNPLIYNCAYSFSFLFSYIMKCCPIKCKSWMKFPFKDKFADEFIVNIKRELNEILDFCNERDMIVKIIFIKNSNNISNYISQILSGLTRHIDYYEVSDSRELNNILHMSYNDK